MSVVQIIRKSAVCLEDEPLRLKSTCYMRKENLGYVQISLRLTIHNCKRTASDQFIQSEVKRPEPTEEELKAKAEEEDLLNKKKALETRRHQLERDVARLEEQLRKELELRKKLESGIMISQQALFSRFSANEKDIHTSNDDNAKNEFHLDSTKSPPQQHLEPTSSFKETHSCQDNDEKHNFQSQSTKLQPTHHHSDSIKDMKKSSSTKPKRLSSRNETTGAMSKITNGLNFLRERSNHLADELQSMNRDRNKSQPQRHARKGSQEFDLQSSTTPNESKLQHLDSHVDRGKRTDDQSTNVENQKYERYLTAKDHDAGP
ncbi:hypothetical protein Tco_0417452 [Tanacetum coccineum]